jgi:methylase of polypeptide subunit release factors
VALLFHLDSPVPTEHVVEALGEDLVASLQGGGLLVGAEAGAGAAAEAAAGAAAGAGHDDAAPQLLRSVLALTCHPLPVGVPRGIVPGDDTLLLVADHGTLTRPDALEGEYVLGHGGAGRTLLDITPRGHVDLAADIGTGCGIQAVLLARHAEKIIATDLSQRALDIARLTVGLAGVADRVEFRAGSLYDPLPEAVDLLVSNPPFVITPRGTDTAFRYRDGGRAGDAIMRDMVTGAPEHLRTGGLAVMLGNWEIGGDRTPPTAWLDGEATATTTSAMVIERQRMRPAAYARTWIRDGGVARASARWHADVDRWLGDFEARGVDEVAFGWILLRREEEPTRSPLRDLAVIESGPGSNPAGLAAFLETRMGLLDWLASADDDEVAATSCQLAADVTEHRHLRPGADDPTMITIEQGGGLAQTFQADPALAGFLGVCDGTLTLAQIAGALAHLLGVEEEALARQLIDQVRTLVPAAIIVPATD